MFDITLLSQFIIYISVLLIAFKIQSTQKKELNNKYEIYRDFLYILIFTLFLSTSVVFLLASLIYYVAGIFFILNMFFIIYFFMHVFKQTRCWKQHRMVYYNFLLIPALYYSSLLLNESIINIGIFLLICIYTVLEFQFAKFNLKQTLMWD